MIDDQPAIYISVLNQGEIAGELSQCLNMMMASSPYPLFIEYSAEKPISYNRNCIVKRFLERTQYDYLLMIDSDIVPPPDYLRLIDFHKDIISGICFAFTKQNIFPLILKQDTKPKDRKYHAYKSINPKLWNGLMECDAVGTGAVILSRKVLEAVPYPFRNEYDKTGEKQLGLDLNFCRRAKKLGFKVFCHTGFVCEHHTRMDLKTLYHTMKKVFTDFDKSQEKIKKLEKQIAKLQGKKEQSKKKQKVEDIPVPQPVGEVHSVAKTDIKPIDSVGTAIAQPQSKL